MIKEWKLYFSSLIDITRLDIIYCKHRLLQLQLQNIIHFKPTLPHEQLAQVAETEEHLQVFNTSIERSM